MRLFQKRKFYPPSQKTTGLPVDEYEDVSASADVRRKASPSHLSVDNPAKPKAKALWRSRVLQNGTTGLPVGLHSLIIFLCITFAARFVIASYNVTCRSVIFSDSTKVKRLYGKRVHERVIPASTTKVMTALLVLEKLPLDSYVTVSRNATYPQPSKIYVQEGERYKVRDLLYAILLSSANDAAVVLAEAVAGTHWEFVQMMNKRAKEIGAKNTRFANAHGLPTPKQAQYTTAYDMYMIFRQALKHQFFSEAIKLKYKSISSSNGKKVNLKSHNKILFFDWKKNLYGKTGYTRAAGACFVGTVQKGNNTLIIAVFNCKNRWDDIKHVVSSYGGMAL